MLIGIDLQNSRIGTVKIHLIHQQNLLAQNKKLILA
ncbi:MAG: hypothetical protein ACI8ZX_003139 [Planctomycetota bacterium]|jgi:hypothetical protein